MKLLKTIKDRDLFPEKASEQEIQYRRREASRAIVSDTEGKIAILNVSNKKYHKLPGGGIEEGEDIMAALSREMIEEIGCSVEVTGEVGQIDELRDEFKLFQSSYCYLAQVKGDKNNPQFVENEIEDGFEIMWVTLDEAIKILSSDNPNEYEGKFILARDLTFLKTANEENHNSD